MSCIHQNSFVVPGTPGYRILPVQPATDASAPLTASGDMIALSYSHGKPSNSSHVMPAVRGSFILPELPEGGKHTVVASGNVDDSVDLTVNIETDASSSGATHSFNLSIEGLAPGLHSLAVVHSNIDYYPDPTGNVSVINGSVGPCPAVDIEPDENIRVEDPCDCGCGCDDNNGDSGGTPTAPTDRSSRPRAAFASSSAGSGIIREARLQYMRWSASFGVFRGMGGIPRGRLSLIGYRYTPSLLAPAGLAYSHPAASCASLPAGGLAPNGIIRIHEGGAYANYICNANGSAAFAVGATSSGTNRVDFVAELTRTPGDSLPLAQAAYLRLLKTDGSATLYHLATGAFAALITPQNTLFTAEDAAQYLDIVREQNGTIRQIWNYWDGLADIIPAENGYAIRLYLPSQITGQDPASELYTTEGAPFKTFAIGGDRETSTLTVTETDHTLPSGYPPYTTTWKETNRLWNITRGTEDSAIATTRTRETSSTSGAYRIITTVSKGGVAASVVAENYISLPVGELLLSRTEGYGSPDALTTTFTYDRVGSRISSTGSQQGETRTIHDQYGRAVVVALPWAGGQNRIINTTYRRDATAWTDEPARIDTTIVDASGIPHLHLRETYAYSEANDIKRIEKRSEANGQTRLEITETWLGTAPDALNRGRLRMTQSIDGIQTWYAYAATTEHGALYTLTEETRIGGTAVPGHSTRSTAWIDAQGNTLRTEQHILDSAGHWQLLAAADYEHDIQNRWITRTRANGRTTTRAHICTGDILRETDENGTTTTCAYDSARQLVETIRSATETTPEIVTSYTKDALGRTLQTRSDIGPMTTLATTAYDLQGRITTQTDTLGRTTAYSYSVDGLTDTITTPAGATLITKRHPDGSILEQSGNGQRELRHEYDYNNARIRHTVKLADQTTILSQNLENGFGETVAVTSPTTTGYLYDRSTYDDKGRIVQRQRDTGSGAGSISMAPTLYEYDAFGNVAKETWKLAATPTLANSRITTWAYSVEQGEDGIYRVASISKNNGKGTTYQEINKELISQSSPLLESKTVSIDPRGHITTQWSEYGQGSERTRKITIPTSSITALSTIIDGFETTRTDSAGITSSQTRTYTAEGLRLTQTDGRGNATVTLTDIAGRPVSSTDAAGHTTATQYCPCCDNPACITDALGHTARYAYDIRGRKTAEWGTGIQPARYAYDEADHLTALTTWRADEGNIETDPTERTDGDTTNWAYHPATGQETCKTYADGTTVRREYNVLGLIGHLHNARGNNATCIYDTATGLLKEIIHSDGTPGQQNTWNHIGNLYRIVDAQGTRDITYNNYNEKETESITVSGIKHTVTETYDALGRPAGYTLDKAGSTLDTVAWRYGTDGRLSAASFLHAGEEKTFAYGYLPGSNLIRTLAHPNGLLATRSYETQRDLPTAIDTTRGATGVALRSYSYDALGRPATRTVARQGTTRQDTFAYNTRSELAAAALGADPYAYTYDNIGNRKTAQEQTTATAYDANHLNQYTAIAPGVEEPFLPAYDEDGNQTTVKTQTGTWTVACNADNRPTRYTSADGATVIENGYDYMGRRYMKKVTVNGTVVLHQHYLYRGYLQIAAIDLMRANAPTLWHLHWDPTQPVATRPLSLRKNGTWYTYGHDLTKNVMELYNADSTIATAYDYTPYGTVTAIGLEQPIQWSSEHYDTELGMVYYNYRHYNPMDGRWINRDPIAEKGGKNLYAFIGNNGLLKEDVLGMADDLIDKIWDIGVFITTAPTAYALIALEKTKPARDVIMIDGGLAAGNLLVAIRPDRTTKVKDGLNECAGYKSIKLRRCCDDDGVWKDDDYPHRAKKICDGFIEKYTTKGKVQDSVVCVAKCLVESERITQAYSRCQKRNSRRLSDHFACYAKCGFVPDFLLDNGGIPEGGWKLGITELLPDAVSEVTSDVLRYIF